MEIKYFTLFAAASVFAIWVAWRYCHESSETADRMREQYRFAKAYINGTLSSYDVTYVMNLNNSARAANRLILGRKYLHLVRSGDTSRMEFRAKYASSRSRRLRKYFFFFLYAAFVLVEASEIGDLLFNPYSWEEIGKISIIAFETASAWISLKAARQIYRAEMFYIEQEFVGWDPF